MVNHIPSLYQQKPTLNDLYTEDNTLFSGMLFPEGITAENVRDTLLLKFGTLETIFATAAAAKSAFTVWSSTKLPDWSLMWAALQEVYNPLENYSMVEEMSDDETVREYGKSTTRTDNLSHTKTGTESGTNDTGIYGFNSAQDSPDSTGENQTTYNTTDADTGTQVQADSGSDTETRNYTMTRSGNIGVTTSQQMLESEMELRSKWNMYEVIAAAFSREFCVMVW